MDDDESVGPDGTRPWRMLATIVTVVALIATVGVVLLYLVARDDRETALRDRDRARAELAEVQGRLDAETARLLAADEAADARASVLQTSEANADRLAEDLAEREETLESYRDATLELLTLAFADGSGIERSGAECIALAFVAEQEGDALRGIVDAANGGGGLGPLSRDLERFASDCGVDLEEAVETGRPGNTYGDDPVLDGLYDACESGDGRACDDLYLDSGSGTEYERFGLTCGDRFTAAEAPAVCADAI